MVRGLPIVLVRGEARANADRDGDGDCRFFATYSDEGSSRIPRTLFSCRMDRLWHLGGPRVCPAIREIECKTIRLDNGDEEINFRTDAGFGRNSTLMYTFQGETIRHP